MKRTIFVFGASGVLAGVAAGVAAVALTAGGAAGHAGAIREAAPALDAAHLPPLLTLPGEDVTLRYAILCDSPGGAPCDGSGDVYIRPAQSGAFRKLPLERGADSTDGRWFAHVPPDIAGSPDGFSYYAVLRDDATGATMTLPAGGADAPQRSFPLADPLVVDLGRHAFGATRNADARAVGAQWGAGEGELGVSGSPQLGHTGPSAFDVDASGTVSVLDQVNSRVERWTRGKASTVALPLAPGLDDFAVEPDGSFAVLESNRHAGRAPMLRTFAPDGTPRGAEPTAERTWSQLAVGPHGPVVQQAPSEQWMPPGLERKSGRPGRPLPDGSEVVVLRSGAGEVRVARIAGGGVRQAWRIRSETPLGEVQLADVDGARLVLVVKAYTDTEDEFEVLVLHGRGAVRQFSVDSAEWAESAPLARFRLAGNSLYQLGTTAAGAVVDRFDLEVNR